jgi:hypothetical protein
MYLLAFKAERWPEGVNEREKAQKRLHTRNDAFIPKSSVKAIQKEECL